MSITIVRRSRAVVAGRPCGQSLRVIPILGPACAQLAYRVLDEATLPHVTVTEVSEAGSVPTLGVANRLPERLFLLDGQELRGAKQNRILNTDVLVPAGATLDMPVSCVERGRWRHTSPAFVPGKSASHRTRSAKAERVHTSLRRGGRHDADQGRVWAEVEACLISSAVISPTSALADAYAAREAELAAVRRELTLPVDAVGAAVFRGGELVGLDLFDRPATLAYFWASLVDSYAIDLAVGAAAAPAAPPRNGGAEEAAVRAALDAAAAGRWEQFSSPGQGVDWRLADAAFAGSALVWGERTVVHLQLFPRPPASGTAEPGPDQQRPRVHRGGRSRGGGEVT